MIETQQTNRYEVAEIALRSKLEKLADLASELIDLGADPSEVYDTVADVCFPAE